MITLITVLKGSGRYAAVWVERLTHAVRRHASAFDRVLCLTWPSPIRWRRFDVSALSVA